MFRITEDPSSESLVQCLAKITRMVLSCPLTRTWSVLWQHIVTGCLCVCVCVCSSLYRKPLVPSCTVNYTHTPREEYAAITPTTSISTDTIKPVL